MLPALTATRFQATPVVDTAHRAHQEWTPARLLHWAGTIGIVTGHLVAHLLESKPHPEQGYRQPTTGPLFIDTVLPAHTNVRGPEYYH